MAEFIKAIEEKDLKEAGLLSVHISGQAVCLAKTGTKVFAFDDTCTHAGCSLAGGLLENGVVECPCHGARFSIESGSVLALPATQPVKTYPVKVENGWVMVEV